MHPLGAGRSPTDELGRKRRMTQFILRPRSVHFMCILFNLEEKWGEKYPIVIKSWQDNWERLTEYFQFTSDIRRMIYTTNTVEGYHRQVRKVTKNKGVFPNDTALEKLVYLAYRNIRKKWTMPLANWGAIAQQLAIKFGDRFKLL